LNVDYGDFDESIINNYMPDWSKFDSYTELNNFFRMVSLNLRGEMNKNKLFSVPKRNK